jgi:tetratricopeptide (TPR) repeat protein/DNA-binding CsgD family transcriptional regulator
MLLTWQQKVFCFPADTSINQKNIFWQIRNLQPKDRVAQAGSLYRDKLGLRKASPAVAMAAIGQLAELAVTLNDKPLACSVFDLRADYYSVNLGFNDLSTGYYQKAIDLAKANNLLFETGLYLHKMGMYYSTFKQNALACRYFLRSQEIFNQVGYSQIPNINLYLSQVADFYYRLGDYENARTKLQAGLRYITKNSGDEINMLNTIGLIYRSYKQFPQALSYFNKAIAIATITKNTIWIGIATGNIGSVYFLQNQYQKALPLIEMDYKTSMKYGEGENGTIALLRLIKINIDTKNFEQAGQQLKTAEDYLAKSKNDVLGIWADYYDLESQLYERQGQAAQSIIYRKKFEQDKDSLVKRDNVAAVERVKLQYEIDKHNAQVSQLKDDAKIQSVEIKAGIAVLVMLGIISVLVYNNQRQRNKKDTELLMAEKRVVDEELKNAASELKSFTENLRQKNILIEKFKTEIDRLRSRSTDDDDTRRLEILLQAHIMTDDNWQDFKKLFSKVYPGFFIDLSKNYPQLSATDTRLLTLLKLGLTNSEMANMLGITIEGIQKAKQRLRKKLDLNTLSDIGHSFSVN